MAKVPVLKPQEVTTRLQQRGFKEVRQRGSHKQFRHTDGRRTTVPFHSGRDISPILLRQICKDIGCTLEEFVQSWWQLSGMMLLSEAAQNWFCPFYLSTSLHLIDHTSLKNDTLFYSGRRPWWFTASETVGRIEWNEIRQIFCRVSPCSTSPANNEPGPQFATNILKYKVFFNILHFAAIVFLTLMS